jgi:hypothetical protein
MMDGVLYICTGEKYIRAAMRSALTVRKFCPGLPIHLYADWQDHGFDFDRSLHPFTSVGKIENPHARTKVDYMALTPFERTLYLDTDTALNADIRDMFRVLERFDIALAHAHHRGPGNLKPWRLELPDAFPEYNSGVILYRSSPATLRCLADWGHHFGSDWVEAGLRNEQLKHDQTPLRELLWLSDLRIATLPPEYNVRYLKYHYLWSRSEAVTKIFHLKRFHMGWWRWLLNPVRSRGGRLARKLGFGPLLNLTKKR